MEMKSKLLLSAQYAFVQVGIGINNPSSLAPLEILSTDNGLFIARLDLKNTTDTSRITKGNLERLLIYNTKISSDVTIGFYYWKGAEWKKIYD